MWEMNARLPISAVIITFNEEEMIEGCLNSIVNIVDEIVVIDSFSTDRTMEICLNRDVKFHQFEWAGYSHAKNKGNHLASHEMILSIDADERIGDILADEIKNYASQGYSGAGLIRRKNYYGDKWIKHSGWYPDKKIRLFNKNLSHWSGEYVHERLICSEPIAEFEGHIIHYTIKDNIHHLNTIHKYAKLASERTFEKGKILRLIPAVFSTVTTFIKTYLFKLGYLDGMEGYKIAINSARSKWLRYTYFKELARTN